MKRLTALLMALAMAALVVLPAAAQGDDDLLQIDLDEQNASGISGTATLEDQGDGTTRVDLVLEGVDEEGEYPAHIHAGQCPEPGAITYPLEPVAFNTNAGAGVSVTIVDAPIDEVLAEQSAINVHLYTDPSVYVACGTLPVLEVEKPDTGFGDDMVTKTFELTINGTVPEGGEAFQVSYSAGGEATGLVLCSGEAGATRPVCEGGETYSASVDFPEGTTIGFAFERFNVGVFHEGTETLDADMTNTAWYTFGKATGTGDDQQGEMPGEMPDTGAGGLAPSATIPVGNAATGLVMLAGAGYAVLRRR